MCTIMGTMKDCKFNEFKILYCKFCNKECHSLNSLKQHEIRCSQNPNRRDYDKLLKSDKSVKKGDTWKTNPTVEKCRNSLIQKYNSGYVSPNKGRPGTFLGKHHTEESKRKIGEKVSVSLSESYRNGTISPARGVGRGKYSYIEYNNHTYMLRSTYEFIYALYLIYNNIDFELEAIRVPASEDNPYAKTFISDFSFLNKVVEIKGVRSGKDTYIKQSFEKAGYEFVELFKEDIENCKKYLVNLGIPVDELLQEIIYHHDNKTYFRYIITRDDAVVSNSDSYSESRWCKSNSRNQTLYIRNKSSYI